MGVSVVKPLAAVIGTALFGVYVQQLFRLRGRALVVAIIGTVAVILMVIGLS